MTHRTFEEITPGEIVHAGPIQVTREAIIAFAQMYDPQPFHLDEAAAANSLLGGLAASGWQTAAFGMRLYYDGFVRHVASMGAPGVDEVRWVRPVRPGDSLNLVLTIGETRVSASKPDRGLVAVTLDIRNGAGETVMVQRGPLIVQRRGAVPTVPDVQRGAAPAPVAVPPVDLRLTTFYDEVEIGIVNTFGTQVFTPDLITTFARLYDPQYFHLDAEAARHSHFGGLIASGWQTAAFWMKHYLAARQRSAEARSAAGLAAAVGGPSPGLTNLKWTRPVHADAAITYGMTVTGKRKTSRPGWGLIQTLNTGHAADGALVFSFDGKLLWPMEPDQTSSTPR